jgi:hypothetical protein
VSTYAYFAVFSDRFDKKPHFFLDRGRAKAYIKSCIFVAYKAMMRMCSFPEELMLFLKIKPRAALSGIILRSVCAIYKIIGLKLKMKIDPIEKKPLTG